MGGDFKKDTSNPNLLGNKILDNFISYTNGALASNVNYNAYDYIPVIAGQVYVVKKTYDISNPVHYAFYNSSKVFIAGSGFTGSALGLLEITAPANAVYIRIDEQKTNLISYFRKKAIYWSTLGDSVTYQNRWQPTVEMDLNLMNKNLGIGGTRLTTGAANGMASDARIATIPAESKVITVMGGINDWVNNVAIGSDPDSTDTTNVYGAINEIIRKIKTTYPNAKFIVQSPNYCEYANRFTNPAGVLNNLNLSILDYAAAIKSRCVALGVKYIDISTLWNTSNLLTYVYDESGGRVHPNDDGGALMAYKIERDMYYFIKNVTI